MSHVIACLWNGVCLLEIHYGETRTWIQVYNFDTAPWYTNYIEAFFCAVSVTHI